MCQFPYVGMNNWDAAVSALIAITLKHGSSNNGRDISVRVT